MKDHDTAARRNAATKGSLLTAGRPGARHNGSSSGHRAAGPDDSLQSAEETSPAGLGTSCTIPPLRAADLREPRTALAMERSLCREPPALPSTLRDAPTRQRCRCLGALLVAKRCFLAVLHEGSDLEPLQDIGWRRDDARPPSTTPTPFAQMAHTALAAELRWVNAGPRTRSDEPWAASAHLHPFAREEGRLRHSPLRGRSASAASPPR